MQMADKPLQSLTYQGQTYVNTPLSTAPTFDIATDYTVGDYVFYDRKLYKFTSAHAAGYWDGSQVEEVTLADEFKDINNNFNEKVDKVAIGNAGITGVTYTSAYRGEFTVTTEQTEDFKSPHAIISRGWRDTYCMYRVTMTDDDTNESTQYILKGKTWFDGNHLHMNTAGCFSYLGNLNLYYPTEVTTNMDSSDEECPFLIIEDFDGQNYAAYVLTETAGTYTFLVEVINYNSVKIPDEIIYGESYTPIQLLRAGKQSKYFGYSIGPANNVSAYCSYALGISNVVAASYSTAIGMNNTVQGAYSFSSGYRNQSQGSCSISFGYNNISNCLGQLSFGHYNQRATNIAFLEAVGNGTDDEHRSNARVLDYAGNETLAGKLTVGANPVNDMDVTTKQYVDNAILNVVDKSIIAPEYEDLEFPVLKYTSCWHDGDFYVSLNSIQTSEEWDSSHWTKMSIGDRLRDARTHIDTIVSTLQNFYVKPGTGIPASDLASGVIPDVSGKADKVQNATNGNFASLDVNGNLIDSGHKHSDYLTQHQDISGKADQVQNATNGNFASLDANGNLTDSGHKHSDYLTEAPVTDVQVNDSSILDNGVANIPTCGYNRLGVVRTSSTYGIATVDSVASAGQIYISRATLDNIKEGTNIYKPIVAENQHQSVFYGLAKAAGDSTQSTSSNSVGTYTDDAKASIQSMLGVPDISDIPEVPVTDVQVNGTSVLSNGVANIPLATTRNPGVVMPLDYYGTTLVTGQEGVLLAISRAIPAIVKEGTSLYRPIVPSNQHISVFYGLAKASGDTTQGQSSNEVGTYTEEAKASIRSMIGAISNTDYASSNAAGVSKVYLNYGIASTNTGFLNIARADSNSIKLGTDVYKPIVPINQHESVFYGLAKAAGDTTQAQSENAVGTYTDEAKTSIRSMLGAVGTADWAGVDTSGVVMLDNAGSYGLYMTSGHYLRVYQAADSDIKNSTNAYRPVTAAKQHQSVFYGLAKAAGDTTQSSSSNTVGTYTDSAKDAIKTMLGIDLGSGNIQTVSGTTPTITGEPNARYICGEVSTISITPPTSGTIIVRFTSGSTATVLTLPNTVKMPAWFDSTSLETDTIYEISITDGVYGAVMLWAI